MIRLLVLAFFLFHHSRLITSLHNSASSDLSRLQWRELLCPFPSPLSFYFLALAGLATEGAVENPNPPTPCPALHSLGMLTAFIARSSYLTYIPTL